MVRKATTRPNDDMREGSIFTVLLKPKTDGPVIAREPVRPEDLRELHHEVWLDHLRDGRPDLAFEDLVPALLPVYRKDERGRCDGLIVQATAPGGEVKRRFFTIHSLAHVAERATGRLLESGRLSKNQYCYFEVVSESHEWRNTIPRRPSGPSGGSFKVTSRPLTYETVPLHPLLEKARSVGPIDDWIPVFYSDELFIRMERLARRGARGTSPVESGAILLGSLCSCPDTGEFFVAATDAIELTDVEQTRYSLSLSGKTWSRIQNILRVRQSDPANRSIRMIGQCHGHNFLPGTRLHEDSGKDCESCTTRDSCDLTSVFASTNDLLWTRSVFTQQPWAFCHIFGLDARGGPAHALYGFEGNRLARRGFYLVPDLEAELECSRIADPATETVLIEKEER